MTLKQNYSFYWFHYLKTQLKYLNFWQKKIKDLELLLIIIQCAIQASNETTSPLSGRVTQAITAWSSSLAITYQSTG